jgi:hypothetical protein
MGEYSCNVNHSMHDSRSILYVYSYCVIGGHMLLVQPHHRCGQASCSCAALCQQCYWGLCICCWGGHLLLLGIVRLLHVLVCGSENDWPPWHPKGQVHALRTQHLELASAVVSLQPNCSCHPPALFTCSNTTPTFVVDFADFLLPITTLIICSACR